MLTDVLKKKPESIYGYSPQDTVDCVNTYPFVVEHGDPSSWPFVG